MCKDVLSHKLQKENMELILFKKYGVFFSEKKRCFRICNEKISMCSYAGQHINCCPLNINVTIHIFKVKVRREFILNF